VDWFGWLWDGEVWERVCGPHPTLGACSDALGVIAKRRGIPAKHTCMTGGGVPRFTPDQSFRYIQK
jgi:hypothetical protein